MNGTYTNGILQAVLYDLTVEDLDVYLLDGNYVPDFTGHTTLESVNGIVAGPVTLTGVTTSGGRVFADPVVFPAVEDPAVVRSVLVVLAQGPDPEDRKLLSYASRRHDTRPINLPGNGDDVVVAWSPFGIFNI